MKGDILPMELNKAIKDLALGDEIEGFYVLKEATAKVAVNGKPFLNAVISDRSGSINMMVWDYAGPVGAGDVGKVIKVRGEVNEYRAVPQINALRLRLAVPGDRYALDALVPVAPIDAETALCEIESLIAGMEDADYRAVCQKLFDEHKETFRSIPAAKSVHHSFISGLLYHTRRMLAIADFLAGLYPEVIDRSLLLAGTLLHDFMKEEEFTFSPLGLVTDYSEKGQLLGHLVMGAEAVGKAARAVGMDEGKTTLLQHLILSHHGEPDYGAAVKPMCAESELLSLIDMIDSRMEIYAEAFETVPVGEFSQRLFALDKKIYHHP